MLGMGEVVWGGCGVRVIIELRVGMEEELVVVVVSAVVGEVNEVEGASKGRRRAAVLLVGIIGARGAATVCDGYGHQ